MFVHFVSHVHGTDLSYIRLILCVLACSCVMPVSHFLCHLHRRLAIMDQADHLELSAEAAKKAKEALEMGKAAVDKLVKDCKVMIGKIKDKGDDLYESLLLGSCVRRSTKSFYMRIGRFKSLIFLDISYFKKKQNHILRYNKTKQVFLLFLLTCVCPTPK